MQILLTESEYSHLAKKESVEKRDKLLSWAFEHYVKSECAQVNGGCYCDKCAIPDVDPDKLLCKKSRDFSR